MGYEASAVRTRRPAAVVAALVVAAGLIAGGCSSGSSSSSSSALACPSKRGAAVTGTAPAATVRPAAGWTQPDADLASTRDVASAITSTDVSKLGVAWTMPLTMSTDHTDGAYATTPVIVNGVVYVQDLDSNVYAISLASGKVLWTHDYNSPNGGPDGVTVAGGVVYAATSNAAVALNAATGAQLCEPAADPQRPRGHRHGPRLQQRHRVRVHRAGQCDGPVPARRRGDLVGAERQDGRSGVVLGLGAEPVGQPGRQLRRRAVVHAVVRRPGQHLPRHRQPRTALRHQELPVGEQPGPARTCTPTRWSS